MATPEELPRMRKSSTSKNVLYCCYRSSQIIFLCRFSVVVARATYAHAQSSVQEDIFTPYPRPLCMCYIRCCCVSTYKQNAGFIGYLFMEHIYDHTHSTSCVRSFLLLLCMCGDE